MNGIGWITLLQVLSSSAPSDTLVVPLQEVIVTGTRTPTSILRTPAAVSMTDRRQYGDSRGISLQDALGLVPGVLAQSRAGAQDIRITIRGFGARGNGERSNAGSMRGVRIMTDGIPLTEPDGRTSPDLIDLGLADRVEIARSNSSTLYGNASGGVVHLRTNLQFSEPYFEFRERAGSFGYHREQGVGGFTAGGARGARGVAMLSNATFSGWRDHSDYNATLASMRMSAPLDDRTRIGLLLDGVSDLSRFPGPLTRSEMDSFPSQANARYVSRDERRRNLVGRVAVSLDRSMTPGRTLIANLFVEPKVLQRSERGRFRDFNRYHIGGSATLEDRRRYASQWQGATLLGFDEAFQDGSILFYNLNPDGSRGTDLAANKRESANSAGAFIQQEMTYREHWSLRLAARFDQIDYISADHISPQYDAEKTFTHWTPKGSLSYAFDRHTVYAAVGGGVEAPAFNEIDPPPPFDTLTSLNPFLEAMTSTTYEVGVKGDWVTQPGPRAIAYDVALYQIDVSNDIVPFAGGAFFKTAGASRRRGFELGMQWTPLKALVVNGTMTLSDNEYVDYQSDLGNYSGSEVPGLPRAAGAISASWTAAPGLSVGVSSTAVGEYFADDANTVDVPGYNVLGARVAYERGMGGTRLRAYVAGDNLTDVAHTASVFINPLRSPTQPTDYEAYEPGLPRSWSGGLTFTW